MKLKICVVPDCLSTSLNEPDLAYHKFPSCADTRRTWTERMKVVAENMRHPIPQVCSKHFRKDDYLPYHKTCKRMLKKGAAPTIFPWGIVDSPTYIPAVSQIPLKRRRRRKFIPRPAVLNNILDRDAIPVPPTDAGDLDDSIADISTENSRDISKRSEESKDSETFSSKNIFESENSDHGSVTDTSSVSFTPEKNKHQRHGHGKYALGVRLEAKDVSSNKWYKAKVVEVDWEDAEVLIHFEQWSQRFDEWIPMDSPRLRPWQNHSPRSSQTAFRVGETVMASWTDNRKYAARIKSILSGDKYEVQFFDGFVKTVKGHKISKGSDEILAMDPGLFHNAGASTMTKAERRERKRKIGPVSELFQLKKRYSDAEKSVAKKLSFDTNNANESKDAAKAVKISSSLTDRKRGSDGKSRQRAFPVIKVNLDGEKPKVTPDKKKPTVNLRDTPTLSSTSLSPMVPVRALKRRKRDDIDPSDYNNWEPEGEEAWVVESSEGLRRSIIVNDDRLPPGWNKHSIQRKSGNSAGKWDVFLVSPTGRRFRSRKEMTSYFAERGEEYQPDIFDFTLRCKMRRKNKDTEHMKEKIKKPGSKRYSRTSATSVTPPVDKVLVDDSPVPVSRRVKTLLPRSLEERGTLIEPPPPHPSSQGVLPGEPENGAESVNRIASLFTPKRTGRSKNLLKNEIMNLESQLLIGSSVDIVSTDDVQYREYPADHNLNGICSTSDSSSDVTLDGRSETVGYLEAPRLPRGNPTPDDGNDEKCGASDISASSSASTVDYDETRPRSSKGDAPTCAKELVEVREKVKEDCRLFTSAIEFALVNMEACKRETAKLEINQTILKYSHASAIS